MDNILTPTDSLVEISKYKYLAASIPFLIIIISFATSFFIDFKLLNQISLIAFVFFLLAVIRYRVNLRIIPPPKDVILSPINGKVVNITTSDNLHIVKLKKSFLDKADVRFSNDLEVKHIVNKKLMTVDNENSPVSWRLEGEHKQLSSTVMFSERGLLFAILPANSLCVIQLPATFDVKVSIGERVIAGETIICRLV